MQDALTTAAAIQCALVLVGVMALLFTLFGGRRRGIRRAAADRQLDDTLSAYTDQTVLPAHALDTAAGRAAVLDGLTRADSSQSRDRMTALQLETRVQSDLRRPRDRIRAMSRLSQARLPGTVRALEPYWASQDADACYFSLHYAIPCAQTADDKARLGTAVRAAPFSDARKTDMLRALDLSNDALLTQAEAAGGSDRAVLLGSLRGAQLTDDALDRLLRLIQTDPAALLPALPCLAASSLSRAFDALTDAALHHTDARVRGAAADALAQRLGTDSCLLLDEMLSDASAAVRDRAAQSMAAQGTTAFVTRTDARKLTLRHLTRNGL